MGFSIESTIGDLFANEAAKGILEENLGAAFINNPMISMAKSMSLSQMASMSGGQFPADKLEAIDEALKAL